MDKEKEIEEICRIIEETVGVGRDDCVVGCRYAAEHIVKVGYRKVGEVHEPIIEKEVVNYIFNGYKEAQYSIKATCPICNGLLAGVSFPDTSQEKRDFKEKAILGEIPNYCPHCGARLKEGNNETPKD